MKIISDITASAKELKKPTTLVVTALMIALGVVVHSFATIPISNVLQFKWAFLPMALVGMLYGPIPAAICGGLIDVISTLMLPKVSGGFFIGITLCMVASGFLYGLFLYKAEKITLRIILCTITNFFLITMLMTTAMLTFYYGSEFMTVLIQRFPKVILAPVEAILLILVLKMLKKRLKNFRI